MDKLEKLSFADLESLRQYYTSQLTDERRMNKPGNKEVINLYIDLISEAIETKFQALVTVDEPRSSASFVRMASKKSKGV
ncbi:hypothetical protein HNV11_13310 [Spirosoma taeanense]|uniref:Uncharacterized protein n=1 Tax=Spirosoma taeanense TaxID=2735870 RepID=A0A6M5Y9T6_9BACT|nr:hypothetical protein [Spirosoma taeanense]QJW90284.1 hypothetical protein HNV11_13310 [Spirosoma taeanense]